MLARAVLCVCLTIAGTRLAVDGQPRWLTGVSLFDALGETPPRDADLDALSKWGFTIVRVWAHWHTAIYDAEGVLTRDGEARLRRMIERLRDRGLALELVLLRPGQMHGQPYAIFSSAEARIRAVRALTSFLRPYRNVIFDLYNEHDHQDGRISHLELRILRDAVKAIDPDRLVTVSSTEYHFFDGKGALSDDGRANLREELGLDAGSVGVDLLAAHLPFTADWAPATSDRLRALRSALGGAGREVPIYINETPRARAGQPTIDANAYVTAARAARDGGAAAWVFHTSAGYALKERSFVEALNGSERQAVERIRTLR